jgi:hypothetical protein
LSPADAVKACESKLQTINPAYLQPLHEYGGSMKMDPNMPLGPDQRCVSSLRRLLELHGLRLHAPSASDLPEKTFHSAFLDGFKRDTVNTRCSVVASRHPVGFV